MFKLTNQSDILESILKLQSELENFDDEDNSRLSVELENNRNSAKHYEDILNDYKKQKVKSMKLSDREFTKTLTVEQYQKEMKVYEQIFPKLYNFRENDMLDDSQMSQLSSKSSEEDNIVFDDDLDDKKDNSSHEMVKVSHAYSSKKYKYCDKTNFHRFDEDDSLDFQDDRSLHFVQTNESVGAITDVPYTKDSNRKNELSTELVPYVEKPRTETKYFQDIGKEIPKESNEKVNIKTPQANIPKTNDSKNPKKSRKATKSTKHLKICITKIKTKPKSRKYKCEYQIKEAKPKKNIAIDSGKILETEAEQIIDVDSEKIIEPEEFSHIAKLTAVDDVGNAEKKTENRRKRSSKSLTENPVGIEPKKSCKSVTNYGSLNKNSDNFSVTYTDKALNIQPNYLAKSKPDFALVSSVDESNIPISVIYKNKSTMEENVIQQLDVSSSAASTSKKILMNPDQKLFDIKNSENENDKPKFTDMALEQVENNPVVSIFNNITDFPSGAFKIEPTLNAIQNPSTNSAMPSTSTNQFPVNSLENIPTVQNFPVQSASSNAMQDPILSDSISQNINYSIESGSKNIPEIQSPKNPQNIANCVAEFNCVLKEVSEKNELQSGASKKFAKFKIISDEKLPPNSFHKLLKAEQILELDMTERQQFISNDPTFDDSKDFNIVDLLDQIQIDMENKSTPLQTQILINELEQDLNSTSKSKPVSNIVPKPSNSNQFIDETTNLDSELFNKWQQKPNAQPQNMAKISLNSLHYCAIKNADNKIIDFIPISVSKCNIENIPNKFSKNLVLLCQICLDFNKYIIRRTNFLCQKLSQKVKCGTLAIQEEAKNIKYLLNLLQDIHRTISQRTVKLMACKEFLNASAYLIQHVCNQNRKIYDLINAERQLLLNLSELLQQN